MPGLPKTIDEWKALEVLPLPGRYLLLNLGAMNASLAQCRAAAVEGLPPQRRPDEPGSAVGLPNITIEERGQPKVYRLPLDFGPVVKAIFDEAGRWHANGRSLLPAFYTLGIRADGAYAMPDGASRATDLRRN